jgi:hypothetical protein
MRFTSSNWPHTRRLRSKRGGTTLAEVLMSLMVMSIGVVSLATLFPISALRVLEATHMTNSTVLRFNAEGVLDALPQLVFDPDGNPRTRHSGTNYIVDPLGIWDLSTQLSKLPSDPSFTRFEYNRPTVITRPGTGFQTWFLGEDPASPALFTSLGAAQDLTSLPDTLTQVAEGTVADPFTSITANTVTFPTTDGMDALEAAIAAADGVTDDAGWRVTLFDASGAFSEVRTVKVDSSINPSGSTVTFVKPLTTAMRSAGVGLVRLEFVDQFYTYMYSVRNSGGNVNVDVVVFFKRDLTELSQQVYVADMRRYDLGPGKPLASPPEPPKPGVDGFDDNGDKIVDDIREIGTVGSDDTVNNAVIVDWNPALYTTAPEPPPLRRGGYVYDPVNGLWYRIQSIAAGDPDGDGKANDDAATLLLDTAIQRDNTEDLNHVPGVAPALDLPGEDRNGDGKVDKGGLIIPRGVIAVFPLRAKRLD